MKTLGKPHYVLNQDFYYWKNNQMNKVSKGQEYTWNGCAYSPKNYDSKLNQGITLGEDFVENGGLFNQKVDDVSETDFINEISSNNISRSIKEIDVKDYMNQKSEFKKDRDKEYEQLSYEDKEAFSYYDKAIEIFKKHHGYLTSNEEKLIVKRGKEFLNIDESKFEKYKIMKEKDLALDFAIIFGIKPEEVPSKSSGIKMSKTKKQALIDIFEDLVSQEKLKWLSRDQTRVLKDAGDSTYEKALNDKESVTKDSGKFYRDEEKMKELYDKIEKSSKKLPMTVEDIEKQLQKYSNMENSNKASEEDSKLGQKESEKLEIMRDLAEGVGVLPVNLQDKEYGDLKSSDKLKVHSQMQDAELGAIGRDSRKYLTEEDCRQQAKEQSRFLVGSIAHQPSPKTARDQTENVKYQVNFKADKASILISENMFNQLCEANTPINGKILNPLLWASDEDTGEMICLDSSSILSITKFK